MFKQLIDKLMDVAPAEAVALPDMRRVSVQLLLEVARSDASIDAVERESIISAILHKSDCDPSDIEQIMSESEQAVDQSISFHQHVRLVNEQFDYPRKVLLIQQMWGVAYADGVLDAYEEAFIRQLADLIYVKHRDFVQAKHRVMEGGG